MASRWPSCAAGCAAASSSSWSAGPRGRRGRCARSGSRSRTSGARTRAAASATRRRLPARRAIASARLGDARALVAEAGRTAPAALREGYRAAWRALSPAAARSGDSPLAGLDAAVSDADARILAAWVASLGRPSRAALGPRLRLLAGPRPRGTSRRAYRDALRAHLADAARAAGSPACAVRCRLPPPCPTPGRPPAPTAAAAATSWSRCSGTPRAPAAAPASPPARAVAGAATRSCSRAARWWRRSARAGTSDERVGLFNQIGIPAAIAKASFDGFKSWSQDHARAKAAAEDFARKFRKDAPTKGYLLYGRPGAGKTHLLAATLRYLALEKGVASRYVEFMLLLSDIRAGFDAKHSHMETLRPLLSVPVLAIDELGKERGTEWERSMLDELISRRFNSGLATIFATNYFLEARAPAEEPGRVVRTRSPEFQRGRRGDDARAARGRSHLLPPERDVQLREARSRPRPAQGPARLGQRRLLGAVRPGRHAAALASRDQPRRRRCSSRAASGSARTSQ